MTKILADADVKVDREKKKNDRGMKELQELTVASLRSVYCAE